MTVSDSSATTVSHLVNSVHQSLMMITRNIVVNVLLSHHIVVWLGYLVYCVFVCFSVCLYGYGFLSGRKR